MEKFVSTTTAALLLNPEKPVLSVSDKLKIVDELCGCLSATMTLEEAREERLSKI